ncbi:hypothetical protein KUL25_05635 [Rhodobacteraceae bacterium N5(2021)]|uniref:Transmembrane protein n=1 Tax=Gymnodinialimonas phycosphaerae TaxID=2841589 RepID=A0A975TYC2_9RHOB|nr:hypothetical protein [Gymnodinialimonas phycosphaerae]MBY4892243.1 hypothetical protein [Gymnodinialimonas phycosphaerae]
MSASRPPRRRALRLFLMLFWAALCGLALFGLIFLGLVVYGEIRFVILDCGPRYEWSEANYCACSDIEETNPMFLLLGLQTILPLAVSLLIRFIARRTQASSPS